MARDHLIPKAPILTLAVPTQNLSRGSLIPCYWRLSLKELLDSFYPDPWPLCGLKKKDIIWMMCQVLKFMLWSKQVPDFAPTQQHINMLDYWFSQGACCTLTHPQSQKIFMEFVHNTATHVGHWLRHLGKRLFIYSSNHSTRLLTTHCQDNK